MRKVGVTVGKFMPFHKGHQLMLESALAVLDELHIIVAGTAGEPIDLHTRAKWLINHFRKDHRVIIHIFHDTIKPGIKDHTGTVIDDEFWKQWTQVFTQFCPKATHFVSSDEYGKKAARLLGIKWLPIDGARDIVPISATMIRSAPHKYYTYLTEEAKLHYNKNIAVVGPESTGKSTLVKNLANHFKCSMVNEYGRTLSVGRGNAIDSDDFMTIARIHEANVRAARANSTSPILFLDTELFTTYLFSKIYLGKNLEAIKHKAITQDVDCYLILAPTVPFVQDGWRVIPNQQDRENFYCELIDLLTKYGKEYIIIDESDYTKRLTNVVRLLEQKYFFL